MFFSDERFHFFRPLTSKYREQVVQCLRLLYQRQYSSAADYGQALNRDQLAEILEEALVHSANHILDTSEGESEQRFKNHREHANWVFKQLLECGWIERQVDAATLQSSFPFTRMGRVFAQSLMESSAAQVRTRHRNTRNTLNALEAFLSRGEVYDLMDAYEYSERIITDFSDVIAELEDRKRELVREVESQQLVHQATDHFFEFMEKRFQPDIAVRLSADSVEKHRDDISRAVTKIRRKQKEFKQKAERELRRMVPDLCTQDASFLWHVLDTIEQRTLNAAEVMLPALRHALHSFTKRADIIIRQLSFLNSQADSSLVEVCQELADLPEQEFEQRMAGAADKMATLKLQLIDPQSIKLLERKSRDSVDTSIHEPVEIDQSAQQQLAAQQKLDQAFVLNREHIQNYVVKALGEKAEISTRDLPTDNALDLLAKAHVIELAALNTLDIEHGFSVRPTGERIKDNTFYALYDEFIITRKTDPKSLDDDNEHPNV